MSTSSPVAPGRTESARAPLMSGRGVSTAAATSAVSHQPGREPTPDAGDGDHGRCCRRVSQSEHRSTWVGIPRDALQRAGHDEWLRARGRNRIVAGRVQADPQPRERQQRRDLADHARRLEARIVQAGEPCLPPARLAVRKMPCELAALARAQRTHGALAVRGDDCLDLLAPSSAGKLVVLLPKAPASTEQHALHDGLRDAHALTDLVIGATLELSQHDHPVVALGQTAERAPEIVEPLLALEGDVGRGRKRVQSAPVRVSIKFERHLLDAAGTAGLVDAGVLGDLIDPRLECDRLRAGAQAPQRRDENLLDDVLGTAVIPDHPEHISADPPPVAGVELLERTVTAASGRVDELVLAARRYGVRRPQG